MEKIISYLINEKKQIPSVAEKTASSFERHDDLRIELEKWIGSRIFPKENAVSIEGCTAEMIFELAPFMDGVDVYNFLIILRENPENGKRIISEGFNIKEL